MVPLYVTIIQDHFVKCRTTGVVNWTNTRHYTIAELQAELQAGEEIILVKHTGDENGTPDFPDWMNKLLKGL